MNAWGSTGALRDSVGAGLGVRRIARRRENAFICGSGRVGADSGTGDITSVEVDPARECPMR